MARDVPKVTHVVGGQVEKPGPPRFHFFRNQGAGGPGCLGRAPGEAARPFMYRPGQLGLSVRVQADSGHP